MAMVAAGLSEARGADDTEACARMVLDLLHAATTRPDNSLLWLAWVAVSANLPSRAEMIRVRDALQSGSPFSAASALMEDALHAGEASGSLGLRLQIATGATVVDVTYSAKNAHNSGIQRVVRSISAVWRANPSVVLVAGTDAFLRTLDPSEYERAIGWSSARPARSTPLDRASAVVIPWRGSILFPEVPDGSRIDRLATLAEFSGNYSAAIGHDAIPITGREYVSRAEMGKFSRYLLLVSQLDLVIGVSDSAAADFAGISRSFAARGEPHPEVISRLLPVVLRTQHRQQPDTDLTTESSRPLVLVVGSKEPRKNQDAVVFAAERLWRAGFDFELMLLGSFGWSPGTLGRWLRVARKAGRPISASGSSSDTEIWLAYARAYFTLFPSFQEGFGLPIAESLSFGVPVITSGFGSMAQIARGGGCVLIDPHDDEQLFRAMRDLLSDPALTEALRDQALARPADSWERYAKEILDQVACR